MKKYTAGLLLAMVLLVVQAPSVLASKIIDSGECGENLTWSLDENGTMTISGTGDMDDYSYSDRPWYSYKDDILTLIIGNGVSSIGDSAFPGCEKLVNITISNSVTRIGNFSFYKCESLSYVTLPNSILQIGDQAFQECSNLSSISIPDSVINIGNFVFMGCTNLSSIIIPNSVVKIGRASFHRCASLESVTLPNGISSIEASMFFECKKLRNVTIPTSVTRIGDSAFYSCSNLTSIVIPSSVTSIEGMAFWHCDNLNTITIPSGVSNIGSGAFMYCSSLKEIVLPNSVLSIGSSAFLDCDSLKSIDVPAGVSEIKNSIFEDCDSLETVIMPRNVTRIGSRAFYHCRKLKGITIPENVVSIGKQAFESCVGLKSINLPNGVTHIEERAFCDCENVTNITLPNTISRIEGFAFATCINLKNVYYSGSQDDWMAIQIDDRISDLEKATIHYNSFGADKGIEQYSYSFSNEAKSFGYPYGYRIPLERFQLIYGKTALAKQKYGQAFADGQYWSGSCYGMSTTAGMFVTDRNNINVTSFKSGSNHPGGLFVSDTNTEWGLNLTQFIEAMQISQYSSMCAMAQQQNRNRLSALTSAVSTYDNGGGGPVVICVYGFDRNGLFSGHALLAYHLDGQKIYVYDSNYPNDGTRAVTISDSGWSYPIADDLTWSSTGGSITYVPYETYLSDWTNRGHVPIAAYVSLVADVSDAVIADSKGKEMAVFQHGKIVQGSENVYPVTQLGITADGVSTVPPQIAMWLPADEVYTITNRDTSKSSFEVSLYNVNHGVSVQTNAASVTLLAEDATGTTSAVVESEFCDYSITQVSGLDEVTFQGKTGRDKFVSLIENGFSKMRSGLTASTSVTLNGEYMPTDSLPNGTTAINISTSRFVDVFENQYFYAPVQWAVWNGITNGTSATTFSPQNTCSRNHILTFLWRANGCPTATIQNPFTDINPNADFGKAAVWAYEEGLVSGQQFNGETPCTRSDVVTYLWKLARRPTAGSNSFTDVPTNADYAQAVSWAVERGITKGTTATTFNPSGICTRGQIVTFLWRCYS